MSAHPSEQSPRCLVCGQLLASGLDAEIIRLRALNADLLAALEALSDGLRTDRDAVLRIFEEAGP